MKKIAIMTMLIILLISIVAFPSNVKVVRAAHYGDFAITVTPESPTIYDSINSTVSFELPSSNYGANFSQVSRIGNVFSIKININFLPLTGLPVMIPVQETYQLGKLANDSYSFHVDVQVWNTKTGELLEQASYDKSFTVGTPVQFPPRAYIFIDPASKGAAIGQVFTVDVKINADSFWDIGAYAVTVEYNSTIITLLNATEGGFLKQDGASTWGVYNVSSNSIEAVFTKLSDPVPSGGVDTLFTLQFNVTCQCSHHPTSCNLELNNTDLAGEPHEGPPFPPWPPDIISFDIPYDPRPVPPALPYSHYTVGGTFSVNLGDVNNDGTINLQDLASFANAFGSHCANYHYQGEPASPNWNERADLAPPFGQIGLTDLVTFAVFYNHP